MWRYANCGLSARAIGRKLGRDHHTVRRHLQPARGEELALNLAIYGRGAEARELVALLGGSPELGMEVENAIQASRAFIKSERERIEALAVGLF